MTSQENGHYINPRSSTQTLIRTQSNFYENPRVPVTAPTKFTFQPKVSDIPPRQGSNSENGAKKDPFLELGDFNWSKFPKPKESTKSHTLRGTEFRSTATTKTEPINFADPTWSSAFFSPPVSPEIDTHSKKTKPSSPNDVNPKLMPDFAAPGPTLFDPLAFVFSGDKPASPIQIDKTSFHSDSQTTSPDSTPPLSRIGSRDELSSSSSESIPKLSGPPLKRVPAVKRTAVTIPSIDEKVEVLPPQPATPVAQEKKTELIPITPPSESKEFPKIAPPSFNRPTLTFGTRQARAQTLPTLLDTPNISEDSSPAPTLVVPAFNPAFPPMEVSPILTPKTPHTVTIAPPPPQPSRPTVQPQPQPTPQPVVVPPVQPPPTLTPSLSQPTPAPTPVPTDIPVLNPPILSGRRRAATTHQPSPLFAHGVSLDKVSSILEEYKETPKPQQPEIPPKAHSVPASPLVTDKSISLPEYPTQQQPKHSASSLTMEGEFKLSPPPSQKPSHTQKHVSGTQSLQNSAEQQQTPKSVHSVNIKDSGEQQQSTRLTTSSESTDSNPGTPTPAMLSAVLPLTVDPRACLVSGHGLTRAVAGELQTFMVESRDSKHNRRTTGGDKFVSLLHGPELVQCQVTDHKTGFYTVSYTPKLKGMYELFVGVDNFQLHGSPFSLIVCSGQTDPKQVVATGQGLYRVIAGEKCLFFIQSRDCFGNHIDSGGDKYSVSIKAPVGTCIPMLRDDNNGTYIISYTPTVSGPYEISILLHNQHIMGSPFKITADAGSTYAPACYAEGNGINHATVATFGGFKITACDITGNKKTKGGDNFVAYIRGKSSLFGAHVIDAQNGTYSVAYLVQEQGLYKLEVTLDGAHIKGSPFDIEVAAIRTATSPHLEPMSYLSPDKKKILERNISKNLLHRVPSAKKSALDMSSNKLDKIILAQSLVRRYLAKKHKEKFLQEHRIRTKVADEILATEITYIQSLATLKQVFLEPLRAKQASDKPILSADKIGIIFGNIEFIKEVNTEFAAKLEERMKRWGPNQKIGDIFVSVAPTLQYSYSQYINNYDQSAKTLTFCQEHDNGFATFLETQKKNHGILHIGNYLITPVQRLPRYQLLLEKIVHHTPHDHPDYTQLVQALDKIKEVADFVNVNKGKAENFNKITAIQAALQGQVKNLYQSHRKHLLEGAVVVLTGAVAKKGRNRYLFLFNDLLLVAKSVSSKKDQPRYQLKESYPLSQIYLASVVSTAPSKDEKDDVCFHLVMPHTSMTVQCDNRITRNQWVKTIGAALGTKQQQKPQ